MKSYTAAFISTSPIYFYPGPRDNLADPQHQLEPNLVNQNGSNFDTRSPNSAHDKNVQITDDRRQQQQQFPVNRQNNYQDNRNFNSRFDDNRRNQGGRRHPASGGVDLEELKRNEEAKRFEALEANRRAEEDKRRFEENRRLEQSKNNVGVRRPDENTRSKNVDDQRFNAGANQENVFLNRQILDDGRKNVPNQNEQIGQRNNSTGAAYGTLYNGEAEKIN